jgi:polar amino acid transport system ATP-binding protein
MVFQSFNLFPHMTALENVTLAPRKVLGRPPRQCNEEGYAMLERFGLGDKALEYPDRLSGGQQQRVAIVRALQMSPEVMLLDEITSALDPELVGEVLEVVRELRSTGMTMILATHEMSFAREISDHVCFLNDGLICEQGHPDQLFTDPQHPTTREFLARVIASGRM